MKKKINKMDKLIKSLPVLEFKLPEEPEGCKRYLVDDVVFTMKWVNPLSLDEYEDVFDKAGLEYVKLIEADTYRGSIGVYKLKTDKCEIIIVSESGLISYDNYIMFCNIGEGLQFKVLSELLRFSFKKFLPDVKSLTSYKNKMNSEEFTVINPEILLSSKKVNLERIDNVVKLMTSYINGEIKVENIEGLKALVGKVNKLLYF